jgi:serine/threonine protein phosphatase PrpC
MFSLKKGVGGSAPSSAAAAAGSGSSTGGLTTAPSFINPAMPKASKASLRGTRRRLSVVSDNKLIEGIATIGAIDVEDVTAKTSETVVKAYAGVSKKGYAPYNPRKRNQDALLMEEHKGSGSLIFGVFDGHGEAGDLVSHYFSERMANRLLSNPRWSSSPGSALAEEVHSLESSLLADASIDTEFSGSTAIFGLLRKRQLTIANIGDSRVIIGRKNPSAGSKGQPAWVAVPVSDDHKPDRADEQRRIESRGGRVFAVSYEDGIDGPPRVWLGHMDIPGLAMSRSVGDTVAHTAGVISDPEMHTVDLTPEDKVIVFASDGLWEFMSNQEVSSHIGSCPCSSCLIFAAFSLFCLLLFRSRLFSFFCRSSTSWQAARTLVKPWTCWSPRPMLAG